MSAERDAVRKILAEYTPAERERLLRAIGAIGRSAEPVSRFRIRPGFALPLIIIGAAVWVALVLAVKACS